MIQLFNKAFKQKKGRINTDKKSRRRLLDMELNSDESNNFGLVHMSSDSKIAEENEDEENAFWVMMMWMKC